MKQCAFLFCGAIENRQTSIYENTREKRARSTIKRDLRDYALVQVSLFINSTTRNGMGENDKQLRQCIAVSY